AADRYESLLWILHVDIDNGNRFTDASYAGVRHQESAYGRAEVVHAEVDGRNWNREQRDENEVPGNIDEAGDGASMVLSAPGRTLQRSREQHSQCQHLCFAVYGHYAQRELLVKQTRVEVLLQLAFAEFQAHMSHGSVDQNRAMQCL